MKHRVLWVALAGSVAFNVFFLVGLLTPSDAGAIRSARQELLDTFAEDLGLDAGQRAAFKAWREDTTAGADQRRESWRAQFDAYLDEIVKDEPDPKVIEAYVAAAPGPEQRRRMVERFGKLMEILRPEQRRRAVSIIRERFAAREKARRQQD